MLPDVSNTTRMSAFVYFSIAWDLPVTLNASWYVPSSLGVSDLPTTGAPRSYSELGFADGSGDSSTEKSFASMTMARFPSLPEPCPSILSSSAFTLR